MRLIDADAAKNEYWELVKELRKATIEPLPDNAIGALAGYSLIEHAPSIDAVPVVHGHWIDYKDEHQCSQCRDFTIVDYYVWKNDKYGYCPHCGARMDGDPDADH